MAATIIDGGPWSFFVRGLQCIDTNKEHAIDLFDAAAKGGIVEAEFALHDMYFPDKPYKTALQFYLKAYDGNPEDQFQLANCFVHGLGCEKDVEAAQRWLEESAR